MSDIWIPKEVRMGSSRGWNIISKTGDLVAQLPLYAEGKWGNQKNKANAYKIAAVPQMREALSRIIEAYESTGISQELAAAIDICRDALLRADEPPA